MQESLSEILDNILGLLLLAGSYEISEEDDFKVEVTTNDAGRLIGFRGESLTALQLLINQMLAKKLVPGEVEGFKRVILDVAGWRRQKEEDLSQKSKVWAQQVLESGVERKLEPMPSWQRRIVHMVVSETEGVESESVGEDRDRHIVIRPAH